LKAERGTAARSQFPRKIPAVFDSHAVLFVAIAVIFLSVAFRDFLVREQQMTPARSTYLRIAIIFAVISIVLHVVRWLSA
jgi:hypothetical protein